MSPPDATAPAALPVRRPNFLLITTDQHRADHLGRSAGPVLRTPHLDALAQTGTRFERCYVASPVCMPNRAAWMTGRMPSAAGVRMNGMPLPLHARTFVDVLRQNGWRTGLIGKAHLQAMTDRPAAWRRDAPSASIPMQAVTDIRDGEAYEQESVARWKDPEHRVSLPYYGFEHTELCLEHGDLVGGDYARWLQAQGADAARLCGPGAALPADVPPVLEAWRTRLPEELHPTRYVAQRTIAWLRGHRSGPDRNRPFFLHCSFADPHHPFNPPGRYWGHAAPDDIVLPSTCAPAEAADVPLKRALHLELEQGRRPAGTSRAIAVTPHEARQAIALNFGSIAFIDDAIGRVLDSLQELGLREDTVVVFTSDHGDFMGDHGLLNKGPLHYQGLLRVPMIWSDFARPAAAQDDRLCNALDLSATVLARAGVHLPLGFQGRDLLRDDDSPRTALLVEEEAHHRYPGSAFPARVHSLLTDRWRLSVRGQEGWGELYDLQEDPEERFNLWSDPGYMSLRAELVVQLVQQMQAHTNDMPLPVRVA